MSSNIPKIIHYCWFGGKKLPDLAVKCIDSWKKYLPDYEIKEWNESNYNLDCCVYVREAYEAKKWAFVSDYARFDILYRYGGLYFDTDVELIKPIDDLIERGPFMGCEPLAPDLQRNKLQGSKMDAEANLYLAINPGLGLAVAPRHGLYRAILDDYEKDHFFIPEKGGPLTVVNRTTKILLKYRLEYTEQYGVHRGEGKEVYSEGNIYMADCIYIYPPEFFCPIDYNTGIVMITDNTRSIHHFTASWLNELDKRIQRIRQCYAAKGKAGCLAERLHTLPLRVKNKMDRLGILGTIKFALKKIGEGY